MRRVAAGVVLAALLMLFVARVTSQEKHAPDREATTALVVTVECPRAGVCALHAQMAGDYEPSLAEAESNVLKLPTRHVVSQRGYMEWNSCTDSGLRTGYVINTELQAGRVLKLPHYGRRLNVKAPPDRGTAATTERSPNVGVQV